MAAESAVETTMPEGSQAREKFMDRSEHGALDRALAQPGSGGLWIALDRAA